MTGRSSYHYKRYDDMIGFLVAFEQRAKTMEACCDVVEQRDSIGSDNSCSNEYIVSSKFKHAESVKRSERGRGRTPKPISHHITTTTTTTTTTTPTTTPSLGRHNKMNTSSKNHCLVTSESSSTGEITKSFSSDNPNGDHHHHRHRSETTDNHTIVAVLEEVEVVMKLNDDNVPDMKSEKCATAAAAKASQIQRTSLNNIDSVLEANENDTPKPELITIESCDEKSITFVDFENGEMNSSSDSINTYGPIGLNRNNFALVDNTTTSMCTVPKSFDDGTTRHELFMMRSGSILREHFQRVPRFSLAKTPQRIVFRDPVYEIIPLEQDENDFIRVQSSLDHSRSMKNYYSIGDHVDILEGAYRCKAGRVVKRLNDDLVQINIEIGRRSHCTTARNTNTNTNTTTSTAQYSSPSVKSLYISPKFLRRRSCPTII